MITKEQFKEFEQYWLVEVIRNPDYRYGQAFLNYFSNIDTVMIMYDTIYNVWEEKDAAKAREYCLKHIDA
jgi:hypothetical protein